MPDYLSTHPILGNVSNIQAALRDSGDSLTSTMAAMSYMNPRTPNRRLTLLHSTGTGKTRKALLIALQYNKDITLVAVHRIQTLPFINEMQPGSVLSTLYPGFCKRLDVMTCKSIANAIPKGDWGTLDHMFKDRVIIVDEMHHIRNSGDKGTDKLPLFNSVVSVLARYTDSVVLFLSATPLVDTSSELVGMYTLLKGHEPVSSNTTHMAQQLSGYVSKYTRSNLPSTEHVVKCIMREEGEQWRLYQVHQDDRSSVYSKSGAVSRFITMDDIYASELTVPTTVLIESMQRYVPHIDAVECLAYMSIKMYMLVKHILTHPGYPKFVYDSWKRRGGIDRLIDVLTTPYIGYSLVSTEHEALDPTRGRKLVALHRLMKRGNEAQVSRLLEIINSEENKDGSLVELVLATPQFSESMSFRTCKECHMMSVPWNKTSKEQVVGRINRRSSLWYLPREERRVDVYSYILHAPDGTATVESTIVNAAAAKYRDITPVLDILEENKIELLYNASNVTLCSIPYPVNTRINNRVRTCLPTSTYRELLTDVVPFLEAVDVADSLYSLMCSIASNDAGYNRMVNVAIQAIEDCYMTHRRGNKLSQKRLYMLEDVSAAFVEYQGNMTHVLYFTNEDTVEYQRLSRIDKRVVRMLDEVNWVWVDVTDTTIVQAATDGYMSVVQRHTNRIEAKWADYGYYPVQYILPPCYRLVEYRPMNKLVKQTRVQEIDGRKISRGEKWYHYSKVILLSLLSKSVKLTEDQVMLLYKKVPSDVIFAAALQHMADEGMLLYLPI